MGACYLVLSSMRYHGVDYNLLQWELSRMLNQTYRPELNPNQRNPWFEGLEQWTLEKQNEYNDCSTESKWHVMWYCHRNIDCMGSAHQAWWVFLVDLCTYLLEIDPMIQNSGWSAHWMQVCNCNGNSHHWLLKRMSLMHFNADLNLNLT